MSRNPRKSVRFNLPSSHTEAPPSILRRQTRGNLELDDYQPTLTRRSSLSSTVMSHSTRIRCIEALHGLRDYIKDACNFHGEQYRRALSVPSVNTLCQLSKYIAKLRGDAITTADERVLQKIPDCSKPHPHEQLTQADDFVSRHARNAMRAHRKRARREADFHLLQFTARQLQLPARALKELSTKQRHIREIEAFKRRILKFYGPTHERAGSAPQSPAGRPLTAPRSPVTDPIRWETLHGRLSGTPHDLFPGDMEELALPAGAHDPRAYATGRTHVPPTPPQRPVTSPYLPVRTPPQHYQTSPYVYHGMPVGGYQHTPPQPPVSMPYGAGYAQQYLSTGQTFAPQPMSLPQSINTPQQTVQAAPGVPGMSIPPSIPARTNAPQTQAHTPLQTTLPTPHTPQQQPLPTPQQPLQHHVQIPQAHTPQQQPLQHHVQMPQAHTPQQQPLQHHVQMPQAHTPQQQPLQHPTPGSTNPTTPQQSLPPTPMQQVLPQSQPQVQLQPTQVPHMHGVQLQHVPGSGSFVLPVPTVVPTVLPTMQYPQQFTAAQQPVQTGAQTQFPAGYQQQQQYTQYAQGYQNRGGKQQNG